MKKLSRADFLKLCAGSAAAVGISQLYTPQIAEALESAAAGNPPVIWIQAASCTGCSVSLLNSVHPAIKEVLLEIISVKYHPNVMAAAGEMAIQAIQKTAAENKGKFYLVVEGAVPTKDNGIYCTIGEIDGKPVTALEWITNLSKDAAAVLSVGTCSSFGGIPSANPNPTGCKPVSEIVKGTPVINIPGCPPHPDWIIGTIAHVLLYKKVPELDKFGRPTMFFSGLIHDNCPRRQYFDNGTIAKNLSEPGCLVQLGCKGPITQSDCYNRQWNGGTNWCIRAGAPCIGCVNPGFPDKTSPVYKQLPDIKVPGITTTANTIGKVALGSVAVGLTAHAAGTVARNKANKKANKKEDDGGKN